MRILFVDSRNVCASASAAAITREMVTTVGLPGVLVSSAGTTVSRELPGCSYAVALRDRRHMSKPVTPADIYSADLIVAMTPEDAAVMQRRAPQATHRIFTLREAGRWAAWINEQGYAAAADKTGHRAETDDHTPDAVLALHAARSMGPAEYEPRRPEMNARLGALTGALLECLHPDDIPDPHTSSDFSHDDVHTVQVEEITALLRFLVDAGVASSIEIPMQVNAE